MRHVGQVLVVLVGVDALELHAQLYKQVLHAIYGIGGALLPIADDAQLAVEEAAVRCRWPAVLGSGNGVGGNEPLAAWMPLQLLADAFFCRANIKDNAICWKMLQCLLNNGWCCPYGYGNHHHVRLRHGLIER